MVWSTVALLISLLVLHREFLGAAVPKIPLSPIGSPSPMPTPMPTPSSSPNQAGVGISAELAQVVNKHLSAVYAVHANQGQGSGFLIKVTNGEAVVATNRHVVRGSQTVRLVNFATNESCSSQQVIFVSPNYDVAFVRLSTCKVYNPIPTRTSDTVKPSDKVFTVGNALGQGLSISAGTITSTGATINTEDGQTPNGIKHNALIHRGNSGGPLFSADGSVIGMNTARGKQPEDAFAVSMEMILEESKGIK